MSESYLEIELDQQPIELCKLLKIANLVAGGGEAKVVISEGYVFLNGEVEFQKRKKVYHNDIIEFNGETIQIIINEDLQSNFTEDKTPEAIQNKSAAIFIDKQEKTVPDNEDTAKKNKRKPISF
jgi:ribosome-associated protein